MTTVVNLIGQAWAVSGNGQRRALKKGDTLRDNEVLVTGPGAQIDIDFGNNQVVRIVGEQTLATAQHACAAHSRAIAGGT